LKSTEIYRSPLPYASIEEHTQRVMGSSLVFPCFFQFIFIEQDSIHNEEPILKGLNEVVEKLYKSMHSLVTEHNSSYGGCTTSFGVTASLHQGRRCWRVGDPEGVPVWPCGLGNLELYDDANSNNALDDYLNSYSYEAQTHSKDHLSTNVRTGIYTILSINKLVHGVTDGYNVHQPFKAVIGKYRHAWILGNRQENMVGEEEISLMSDIAVRFFMNGGSFQYQNKVTVEEKGSSIPLAADGRAILSFSLLNAQPKDWIFDW
jgi:phosphatidylinositol glycan class S